MIYFQSYLCVIIFIKKTMYWIIKSILTTATLVTALKLFFCPRIGYDTFVNFLQFDYQAMRLVYQYMLKFVTCTSINHDGKIKFLVVLLLGA